MLPIFVENSIIHKYKWRQLKNEALGLKGSINNGLGII